MVMRLRIRPLISQTRDEARADLTHSPKKESNWRASPTPGASVPPMHLISMPCKHARRQLRGTEHASPGDLDVEFDVRDDV